LDTQAWLSDENIVMRGILQLKFPFFLFDIKIIRIFATKLMKGVYYGKQ